VAQRILRGAAATLTYQHLDANGDAVDAGGVLTVAVAKADGTVVLASGTATARQSVGEYTVQVTAAQTSVLDVLTATWTDSAAPAAARTTEHEIVGGFMFSIAQVSTEPGTEDYDRSAIIARRAEVEDEAEWICDVAWVPRYRRLVLDGTGEDAIISGVRKIRAIRSVRIYPTTGATTYTSLTVGQLAGLVVDQAGTIRRTDGSYFELGFGNIVVEVEHGYTEPFADVRTASIIRCRDLLTRPDSSVPDRARSYTDGAGFSYDLLPQDEFSTGIPHVDAVYLRRSLRRSSAGGSGPGGAATAAPASRQLNYDPQFWGLYRGGRV
jgi:hypothetical protein